MRLRHIEVFHAIYTTGSVSNAAKFLAISQPSVSKTLRHAEDQIGFPLFDRIKGRLVPTQEARRLYDDVSKLYNELTGVRRLTESLRKGDDTTVRFAVVPALGLRVAPEAVASFLKHKPDTKFEIQTLHHRESVTALIEGKIDFAVVFEPSYQPNIVEQDVATAEFLCVAPASTRLTDNGHVQVAALQREPFIELDSSGPLGQRLKSWLDMYGGVTNTVATVETYHLARTLVSLGVGISIIDAITAHSSPLDGLKTYKLDPPIVFRTIALTLERNPPSLIGQAFLSHLKAYLARILD